MYFLSLHHANFTVNPVASSKGTLVPQILHRQAIWFVLGLIQACFKNIQRETDCLPSPLHRFGGWSQCENKLTGVSGEKKVPFSTILIDRPRM